MNDALSCIQDTLRSMLDEAKEAQRDASASRGRVEEAFAVGRAQALAETLHTWSNQLETFGLSAQLDGVWTELREFLTAQGY